MGRVFRRFMALAGLAALAGYVAGILTAPKSGKETREDMKRAAQSGLSEAERQLKNLTGELADLLEEAKRRSATLSNNARQELDDLITRARAAREKAREVVSAVHEGDAQDDDLRIAVSQANSALNHLREYLRR